MKRFPTLAREGKEDLLQECLTHWYFKRNQYDPLKPAAYKTYMSRVIENKLRDLMDHKERQKRKTMYQSISIDELIGGIEDDSYCEELAVDDESFKDMAKADFNALLLKALEKLSGRQQELCRLIKDEGLNLEQISKKLNLPRATVYDEIIRIREFFKREGLNDYLT